MELAKPDLVRCPFCQNGKALFRCSSWNSFGQQSWSDTYRFGPYMPEVSPIQKCEKCGKYFFLSRQDIISHKEVYVAEDEVDDDQLRLEMGDVDKETAGELSRKDRLLRLCRLVSARQVALHEIKSQRERAVNVEYYQIALEMGYEMGNIGMGTTGKLNWNEVKQALCQFKDEVLTTWEREQLFMLAVYKYNDEYYRYSQDAKVPPDEDKAIFVDCLNWLIKSGDLRNIVKAEFLRESERYEECLALLEKSKIDQENIHVAEMIKEKALQKDPVVFEINNE